MKYCTKCVTPETHDTISFNDDGVCSICRQIDVRDNIDWTERRQMLDDLLSKYRDKGEYDCIIPFSGGKDSTFQLWYAVKELKLKPLVVRYDHWGFRDGCNENNERTFKKLGVDVLQYTPSWHVVRATMLEALKRTGDFCWHCHTGVYAHTMQVAIRYNTPLIIWGESLAEYRSDYTYDEFEEVDEKRFKKSTNLGITAKDMEGYTGITERDLYQFSYPDKKKLDKIGCRSICLGNYIKWDIRKHVDIIKRELGWQGADVEGIPPEYDYEKIECKFQGMRDYCRFLKRGYGRTNHLVSIDIRNKRLSRERGWELTQKYDGKRPETMDWFLELLDITEKEFMEIISQHKVAIRR